MKITARVITEFGKLAEEAKRLYDSLGGFSGILDKILSPTGVGAGVGAVAGGIAGAAVGMPLVGAAVGGVVGAGVGAGYEKVRDYFYPPGTSSGAGGGAGGGAGAGGGSRGSLKGDTAGLNSDLQKRLMAASEVYGKPLTINSGLRSRDDQQRLYDESVRAGRPGIGPTGMLVAKPGSSSHERGMAVDIQEAKNDPKAVAALKSQGLAQPYGDRDAVHFELAGPKTEAASGSSKASGTSVQSSPPTATAMSSSDDTLIRVMVDMRNSLNSKMQEMVDKVAESNGILEKIMRRS